jgi:23S rRNA pseudouridine2605 synthase
VGRLDQDTTGLLLFTTDGELSHRLLHPRWKVEKTYRVVADGRVAEADVAPLRDGIELDDGPTQSASVEIVGSRLSRGSRGIAGNATEAAVTIREGRKRQVRRMFSAIGHPVLELHRVRFGPVELGPLPEGGWRELTDAEVRALREAVGMEEDS